MDYSKLIKSIDLKSLNVDFADIRIEKNSNMVLRMDDHEFTRVYEEENAGVFLRIFSKGRWYCTSLSVIDKDGIIKAFRKLINDVSNSYESYGPFWELSKPHDSSIFKFRDRMTEHSMDEYIDLLKTYDSTIKAEKDIKSVISLSRKLYNEIYYGNSQGAYSSYDFFLNSMGAFFYVCGDQKSVRTGLAESGNTFSKLSDFRKQLNDEINETRYFLKTKAVVPGNYPVIFSERASGMFAHEIFGHASEADLFKMNAKDKKEWSIGIRVAQEDVSIIDTGLNEDDPGYAPFDDEGTPATKTYLIKNGILNAHLHSLCSAFDFNELPTGNARAVSAEYEPWIRMTNTYFEKGNKSLDELLSPIKVGIYVKSCKYGGGGFVIAPRKCYMIRDGKIAEPVNVNILTGTTLETLGRINGVSSAFHIHGSVCSKFGGDIRVGNGGSHISISSLNVS